MNSCLTCKQSAPLLDRRSAHTMVSSLPSWNEFEHPGIGSMAEIHLWTLEIPGLVSSFISTNIMESNISQNCPSARLFLDLHREGQIRAESLTRMTPRYTLHRNRGLTHLSLFVTLIPRVSRNIFSLVQGDPWLLLLSLLLFKPIFRK